MGQLYSKAQQTNTRPKTEWATILTVLPYPGQGHINPMLQFSKLLQHEGMRITMVTTRSYYKKIHNIPSSIALETISDGFDNGGVEEAGGWKPYLEGFLQVGPKSLAELLEKLSTSCDHVDCIIYDAMFLDQRLKDDGDYGGAHFKNSEGEECIKWLDNKPKHSVVYVSFGTMATLDEEQIEEVACCLRDSGSYFLWVVKASEETKLPKDFERSSKKGFLVNWCSQLKVLAHEAIGCFVTHCGWNSTLEALSLGVPMVVMPQWSDQSINAKQIVDVCKIGIRVSVDEKKIVRGKVLKHSISEIMESERGREVKNIVMQWKNLAIGAVDEDGSSRRNICRICE